MTKAELRSCMTVVLRNGKEYIVYLNIGGLRDVLVNIDRGGSNMELSGYTEDLTRRGISTNTSLDIVQVKRIHGTWEKIGIEGGSTLWTRPEPIVEYTVAQLEAKLGHKIKVVADV